jgi:hypothetical protein
MVQRESAPWVEGPPLIRGIISATSDPKSAATQGNGRSVRWSGLPANPGNPRRTLLGLVPDAVRDGAAIVTAQPYLSNGMDQGARIGRLLAAVLRRQPLMAIERC